MDGLSGSLVLFAIAASAALVGVELGWPRLFGAAKPIATLSLLGVVGMPGRTAEAFFAAGIALSAAGDIALLYDRPTARNPPAFMGGLVLFLLAHIVYAAGFLTGGAIGAVWTPLPGVIIFGIATAWLVRHIAPTAGPGMSAPLALYGVGLTVMGAIAFAALGGPWPQLAGMAGALGALLFYLSDVNLAWSRFRQSFPHAQTLVLSLYWTGQLGLAFAARWAHPR